MNDATGKREAVLAILEDSAKCALRALPPRILLALDIHGEAGGEDAQGQLAAGYVVKNRLLDPRSRYGSTYQDVILAPWQFSYFNDPLDVFVRPAAEPEMFHDILTIAQFVIEGVAPDPTASVGGATAYHAPDIVEAPEHAFNEKGGERLPYITIGRHEFYRLP